MGNSNRPLRRSAFIFGASLVVAACGGGDDFQVPPGGNGDGGISGGSDGSVAHGDGGTTGDGGTVTGDGGLAGPPTLTLVSPTPGTLLAGTLNVDVKITAPSSVKSVTATIAGTHQFTMRAASSTTTDYVGTFDTTVLDGLLFPTVVVRATSATGEEAELGFEVALDNSSPIASLDPADVRVTKLVNGVLTCSAPVDPLGSDAPNDGESVPQISELRARIVDRTNAGTFDSTVFVPFADVGPSQIYVLDDTTKPLVVDTDGDGFCDDVNPEIVPAIVPMASNEAAVIDLAGVKPSGAAFFPATGFGAPNNSVCAAGTDTQAPAQLCRGEPSITVAIEDDVGTPEVFGIAPVTTDNCLGFAFDAKASNISNGWACAAVLTVDNLGNRNVSAPLRICVDSDTNGANCGRWGTIAPAGDRPNCTGTVDPTTHAVTTTACTPRTFPVVPNDFELLPLPPQ